MKPGRSLGGKIKRIREFKNLSVEELADRTGLDVEQIMLIEENTFHPSLAPLIKIARALSVRLGTFLDDDEQLGPVLSRKKEKNKGASFSNKNIDARAHLDFFALASGKSGRHMEPFIVDVHAKAGGQYTSSSHEGEEFIFVLEGKIAVTYGKESYVLDVGDSIYYDSIVEHHVHCANDNSAKILAVVYTPV
ncbi:MAG: helix-turn-helix domain-containing protein [Prolixibacteraceae bacterium]